MPSPSASQKRSQSASSSLVIAVVGPTASGKSSLAVAIAKAIGKRRAAVISADSRQIYQGLDIGSGKVTKREMEGVPHYLLDIASPKRTVSVAQYSDKAARKVQQLQRQGITPIICGGTGQYVDALLLGHAFPNVPPQPVLRKKLSSMSTHELFVELEKLDPVRAQSIDRSNPRRLVRALEIVMASGKPVPPLESNKKHTNVIWIGLQPDWDALNENIHVRLATRLRRGMVREVAKLHESGVSWKRLDDLGLEYRYVSRYLCGMYQDKSAMQAELEVAIRQYAKRQWTWFKRNKQIVWFKNQADALAYVKTKLPAHD